jgi:uncharacterized protein GlcG (DUF336 family)
MQRWIISGSISLGICIASFPASAQCAGLPSQATLQAALENAVSQDNGGLGFNMWASVVANDGTVCAIAFSGNKFTDQWLGSRVISAQKANTANDFSLGTDASIPAGSAFPHGLALSTANLFSAAQPGGSLYGLQHSNPVDPAIAYQGGAMGFGTAHDPLVGQRIGGVNVFGGGLALFTTGGKKVGGIGVSGDTSCTEHFVAWRVRNTLGLDHFGGTPGSPLVGGVSGDPSHPDNIVFDFTATADGGVLNPNPGGTLVSSAGGFGHPGCAAGRGFPKALNLPSVQTP